MSIGSNPFQCAKLRLDGGMVDTRDLESLAVMACGFKSHSGYQKDLKKQLTSTQALYIVYLTNWLKSYNKIEFSGICDGNSVGRVAAF